jgi:hypothetical protein
VTAAGESFPNFNILVKCPASGGELPYRMNEKVEPRCISIVGEYYQNDSVNNADAKPYTIFRCCWCDEWFSVDEKEIEVIRNAITSRKAPSAGWLKQVAERCHPKI